MIVDHFEFDDPESFFVLPATAIFFIRNWDIDNFFAYDENFPISLPVRIRISEAQFVDDYVSMQIYFYSSRGLFVDWIRVYNGFWNFPCRWRVRVGNAENGKRITKTVQVCWKLMLSSAVTWGIWVFAEHSICRK